MVIQNLVISGWVTGSFSVLFFNNELKNGITDPLELATLPYLTTAKRETWPPVSLFADKKILSEVSLVAPYRFTGLAALSVESAIIWGTELNNSVYYIIFTKYVCFYTLHWIIFCDRYVF